MTTYYVRKTGSDGAAGTSPATAWATIGKALGASGIASGDTVYIGAGTYREAITVNMTSATAETRVVGDVDGAQTGDAGQVIVTAYTTNDTTTPAASPTIDLNGRDYLTFENLVIVGGSSANGSCLAAVTAQSTNITIRQCALMSAYNGAVIYYFSSTASAPTWVIERCVLWGMIYGIRIGLQTSASADYDANFIIRNCFICAGIGGSAILIESGGANSFKGGGVDVLNCTVIGGSHGVRTNGDLSTSIPCTVYNSIIHAGNDTALRSSASSQITENYNYLLAVAPRTNVSSGANSQTNPTYAPLVEIGQSLLMGMNARPFGMPMAGSPLLGFGNTGGPTVDGLNRPRPAGGGSTANGIGYLERHDTGAKETTTVRTGSTALVIVGPGDHEFAIPVDATATTVSVYARYDSTHAATNKPQAMILNGTECGVATATATMTAAADTWEQLSFSFTPTATGIVTLRLISRAAAGGGKAFFDDVAVS